MALLGQWKDGLEAHSKPDSISVFFSEPDVVLTTYGLLTAAYKAVVSHWYATSDCSSNPVYVNDSLTNCCRIMCKIFTAAFCVSCMLSHGAIEHDLQLRESLLRIKQKNMAAEGRDRRVLGDIGNVVTARGAEGKQQLPQEFRRAQLLANAQAAPADKSRVGGYSFSIQ
nr:putative SWI/SNF-related matrix-associated actin-dependent regulator of chromatin subfamily A member 3-like 3 isoform X4 [Ipomoea trifida]